MAGPAERSIQSLNIDLSRCLRVCESGALGRPLPARGAPSYFPQFPSQDTARKHYHVLLNLSPEQDQLPLIYVNLFFSTEVLQTWILNSTYNVKSE